VSSRNRSPSEVASSAVSSGTHSLSEVPCPDLKEDSKRAWQISGLDAVLYGPVAISSDRIGTFAPHLGDCLDKSGAPVEQADPVVRGVPVGQHAIGDELLEQWAALRFGVVVDSVRIREQAEAVGHGAQSRPERVGGATDVPAQRAGGHPAENNARLPNFGKDPVETVQASDREQIGNAATADPDHVLVEQEPCHVLDTRHRKQIQVHDVYSRRVTGFIPQGIPPALVAAGRSYVTQPGAPGIHPRQLDGTKDQWCERDIGARPACKSARGCKDGRQIAGMP